MRPALGGVQREDERGTSESGSFPATFCAAS
jgi:hypothetical protein